MATIQIQDLSFEYPGADAPIFQHVTLDIDTGWRLGLVGRNGRGKTTFLRLLLRQLRGTGRIACPEAFEYFPVMPQNTAASALAVARETIAPFDEWEAQMQQLMEMGTEQAIEEYGEVEQQYAAADGYIIDETIEAEVGRLGIAADALARPFHTLSGGEQVKLLLAALFLKKHRFLLIDEPTDHLDVEGRRLVSKWLAGKSGFILVSHDRAFLDGAVDHILSINRADIELQQGNYSSWRHNRTMRDEFEKAENSRLEKSIGRLKEAAARTEKWSDNIEGTKYKSNNPKGSEGMDRGYIGHQAARMMQRSKAIERRRGREIEEKQTLLKNIEEVEPVKFRLLKPEKSRLVQGEGVFLSYGEREILHGLDFVVDEGERVAVTGANGSGKSTLLALVLGTLQPTASSIRLPGARVISSVPQDTSFLSGSLHGFAEKQAVDESLFLAILRKLDFSRGAFTQDMETYSMGQKKKVLLAASLAKPAHLFVWDEPLNYIDVLSREQIEAAVLESQPSMLFVEHDAAFTENVATRRIEL